MIWIALSIIVCTLLSLVIIKRIEKINDLIRSQCMESFDLKQKMNEMSHDTGFRIDCWGHELKESILSAQVTSLKSKGESPVKEIIEEKKKVSNKASSEETRRKQSERRKEYWNKKKKAEDSQFQSSGKRSFEYVEAEEKEEGPKVKPSSFFKRQAAPEAGINEVK